MTMSRLSGGVSDDDLERWIDQACGCAATLPPK
jgi:hypothetical protein